MTIAADESITGTIPRRMHVVSRNTDNALTEAEVLDGITGETPLAEMLGGRGAYGSATRKSDMPRRKEPAPKYVLDEKARTALATYDGTAASLNRITTELGAPRNKILDWLTELRIIERGAQGKRPRLLNTPADAEHDTPEAPPAPAPAVPTAPVKALPASATTAPQTEEIPRVGLAEWLNSGAEGVWFAGSLCVQPIAGDPNSFAILISHPVVPRVPGPVPGHLVEYLVRALVRKSTVTGVVYR